MKKILQKPLETAILVVKAHKERKTQRAQNNNIDLVIGDMNMKTLREAKIGETVRVVKLHGEGAVKKRIMDMGITRGVEVYIRKVAPLGDPIEVTVRGYELSLRKEDASMIEIE